MKIRQSVLDAIGDTPMLELGKLFGGSGFRVVAKLEGQNPGGSMKDRPALAVIQEGMESGEIGPETTIVESSSGNMGIGIAQACCYLGLRFICVVDPRTAPQNLQLLRAYGAEVDMVPAPDPVHGDWLHARINRIHELLDRIPGSFWPDQYSARANPLAHYRGTIREIVEALDGRLDYLFCATSTCGTVCGSARYLREMGLATRVVAVDAVGSVIFSDQRARRLVPGLGAGIKPPLLERELVDEVVHVTDLDCIAGCRSMARVEALLVGGSSGGIVTAVQRLAHRIPAGSVCALVFPDRGERYLDTLFSDTWVQENYGPVVHFPSSLTILAETTHA